MSSRHPPSTPATAPAPIHPPINLPDHSSLDLLSRVALGQYHHNEAPLPSMQTRLPLSLHTPSKSLTEIRYRRMDFSQPPGHFVHIDTAQPPAYLPSFQKQQQPQHMYAPDYSPVSSDDGLSNRSSRLALELPGRITKVVRTAAKDSSSKSRSQPSRFCHICSRTSKKVGLVACGNFGTGACRKVVCQKCFTDHDWDWEAAVELGTKWICTHCRHECPERAQCAIYKRTNERRREQQQQQRSAKVGGLGVFKGGVIGEEESVEMLRLPPLRISEDRVE